MMAPEVLSSLDPRWIEQIYGKETGEDFLGLRAVQGSITGYLMPGIITITPRARYYAFYSWLIVEYGEKHPSRWSLARFIHRREQIYVLASLAYMDEFEDRSARDGLAGSIALRRHWNRYRDAKSVPLSRDDYLQAEYGGYDAYTGVMRSLQIAGRGEEEASLDVYIPHGQKLAQSFATAIADTAYYRQRHRYDMADSIPVRVLVEYGQRCNLSALSQSPDCRPTIEALFAFDAAQLLPSPDSDISIRGNMRGSLGLILEMLDQAQESIDDDEFRRTITYALCEDYDRYRPSPSLQPFLAHWRMFQLREYYVYALYALWAYFLRWLKESTPAPLAAFRAHLGETVDLTRAAEAVGLTLPRHLLTEWHLTEWFDALLEAANIDGENLEERCRAYSQQSQTSLNEHALYELLGEEPTDPAMYLGTAWLLLSALYMRLCGLQTTDSWESWRWAEWGEARRRSLALFVQDITGCMVSGHSILDTWSQLYRDYIIAQHVISALEKWQQRRPPADTFHFRYEEGLFEWVQNDSTGFSASRFDQAYRMLSDMGLFKTDPQIGMPRLTARGWRTLQRVLESCSDQAGTNSST